MSAALTALASLALLLAAPSRAMPNPTSPLNGLTLEQPASGEGYAFWIVGHSYGQTVYPVASLLLGVPEINASDASGLWLLGDTVRLPEPTHIENLRRFARQVRMPVLMAAGNHDAKEPAIYEREFGPRWFDFRMGADQWFVLDLNLSGGAVSPSQLDWFRAGMQAAERDAHVRNVVVVSHHMVWAIDDPRLDVVRRLLNRPADYREGFFAEHIAPVLSGVTKPVYWLSGDIAAFPPFFWRDPERDVTYLATGVKDEPADTIVELRSSAEGEIRLRLVSLSGLELGSIERYGPDFWQDYYAGKGRVLNLKEPLAVQWLRFANLWMFVTSSRFVYGAVLAAAATSLVWVAAGLWWLWRLRGADGIRSSRQPASRR